ncbi:hypothetical protein TELCIR_03511 [Teladorsagia circumcincta]|uniref:Leucine Rich repeat-containing domain protein n=1 Tax=Teladorsagia circumcincta TaxID=45464 RepID=A0A2G9UW42_TELCI|nr:hypothetical protein TELCIR_03511 [Teladorsagia circumcincta]
MSTQKVTPDVKVQHYIYQALKENRDASYRELLQTGRMLTWSRSKSEDSKSLRLPPLDDSFAGICLDIQCIVMVVAFNIPGLRFALFRTAVILATAVHARERTPFAQEDPNLQFLCRGSLSDYAACQCKEDEGEVACINAQFVDTEVFFNLNAHYKYDYQLIYCIIAIIPVNLNSNALKGLPNLRVLDLSNNEIVLKESDVDFLAHTPRLTHLYLRRAFTATINRTVQFDLMMRMFQRANLKHLEIRDKHTLVCDRASPRNFVGARLVEVPLHKLDCSYTLHTTSALRDWHADVTPATNAIRDVAKMLYGHRPGDKNHERRLHRDEDGIEAGRDWKRDENGDLRVNMRKAVFSKSPKNSDCDGMGQ